MGRRWLAEKKREHYYKMAKKAGFRSRAAYKLFQLNGKYNIIGERDYVLDLGAAPGGWTEAAASIAGEKGFVLGIDICKVEPFEEKNICFFQGDITREETIEKIKEASKNKKYNAVISDASPNISGVWEIDHERSVELALHAFKIAKKVLSEDGNFLVKVFNGARFKELFDKIKKDFRFAKASKPKASRKQSAEIYIVAKGYKTKTER